ncbi:MAG: hypothetical protein ACRDMI_00005, partial [Streptosporangiaceae bacterium]
MADHPSGEDHSKRASGARHLGGEANWSRRYRANLNRLNSGDRGEIEAVVDVLSQRDRDYGLSQGERRMLERARQLLQDPPGNGPAGVREPRSPRPSTGAGSIALP